MNEKNNSYIPSSIQLSKQSVETLKKKKNRGESYEAYLIRRGVLR